jgi:hypothetical protein
MYRELTWDVPGCTRDLPWLHRDIPIYYPGYPGDLPRLHRDIPGIYLGCTGISRGIPGRALCPCKIRRPKCPYGHLPGNPGYLPATSRLPPGVERHATAYYPPPVSPMVTRTLPGSPGEPPGLSRDIRPTQQVRELARTDSDTGHLETVESVRMPRASPGHHRRPPGGKGKVAKSARKGHFAPLTGASS